MHHGSSRVHHLHLLNRLLILEEETEYSTEAVDQQECPVKEEEKVLSIGSRKDLPAHGTDIGRVQCMHVNTLLKHGLKLDSQRERHLSQDETLEEAANDLEHHHINNALHVLLEHGVHHVGIGNQVLLTGSAGLFVQITGCSIGIECFASLDSILGQPLSAFANSV